MKAIPVGKIVNTGGGCYFINKLIPESREILKVFF